MKTRILLLTLVLAAFALRVYRIDAQSLWTDEGFGVDFASQDAQRMLQMWSEWRADVVSIAVSGVPDSELAAATDTHAPLYYFLLHFWMKLAGRSELAVRFLSAFFGLLAVPLLYALGRRLLDRRACVYAAALGAASPLYVAYAQETRMYTLSLLFSLMSAYLMVRVIRNSYSHVHLAGYVLSTALALYSHYFTALIVVFENFFALASLAVSLAATRMGKATRAPMGSHSPKRILVTWCLLQACVLLLLSPWTAIIFRQLRFPRNEALAVPSPFEVLGWSWQALNAPIRAVYQGADAYLPVLATLLAVLLILRWITDRASRPSLVLLLLYLFIPLGLTLAILQRQPMFHPRYLIAASPAYYLLLAAAASGLRRFGAALPHVAAGALLTLLAFGLNSYYFDASFAKDDARGVGEFLTVESSADDLVVLDSPEPIGHYYRGKAPYLFLPGDPSLAPKTLAGLWSGKGYVYYVHWWQSLTDPAGYVSYLLAREGRQVASRDFRGFRVDKVAMRGGLSADFGNPRMDRTEVNFDGRLQLKAVGYGPVSWDDEGGTGRALRQGGKLWVVLRWQLLRATKEEYKAFVYLGTGPDRIVGQSDAYLLKGPLPTDRWKVGDTAETYHLLPLIPGTPPGPYELVAGLYEAKSQQRVSVINRDLNLASASTQLGVADVIRFPERLSGPPIPAAARDLGVARVLGTELGATRLIGYSPVRHALTQGEVLRLTLLWGADRDVKEEYAFELEAVARAGPPYSHRFRAIAPRGHPTSMWIKGQMIREWRDFKVPVNMAPGQYLLKGLLTRSPDGSKIGTVDLGEMEVRDRPGADTLPAGVSQLSARFGDVVELIGYDLRLRGARMGEVLELTLYWRALEEIDESFTVFTHLLDGGNKVRAQHDSLPAGGEMPTTRWRAQEIIADRHVLTASHQMPYGDYVLEVGMYDAWTVQRLIAHSQDVRIMGNAALIAEVALRD